MMRWQQHTSGVRGAALPLHLKTPPRMMIWNNLIIAPRSRRAPHNPVPRRWNGYGGTWNRPNCLTRGHKPLLYQPQDKYQQVCPFLTYLRMVRTSSPKRVPLTMSPPRSLFGKCNLHHQRDWDHHQVIM